MNLRRGVLCGLLLQTLVACKGNQCRVDTDCSAAQACDVSGQCVTRPGACTKDSDCIPGQVCDSSGVCLGPTDGGVIDAGPVDAGPRDAGTAGISLNLVTQSCTSLDVLTGTGAQQVTLTVYGPDISTPMKTTKPVSSLDFSNEIVPAGTGRNFVVEAFDSSNKLVARGESGPVTIQNGASATINVFVRAADQFTYVNSSDAPMTCEALGAGSTTPGRAAHSATLLENGKVLIAGGYYVDSTGKQTYLSSTEIFDPTTGHITQGPDLAPGRAFHTATHIPGTPLTVIAGGETATQVLAQAEVYDETQDKFVNAVMLAASTGRTRHNAVLVPTNNGPQLLLIGGFTGNGMPSTMSPPAMTLLSSGEIFNANATPSFTDAGFKIPNGLAEAGAAVTNTGRVMLLGGITTPNGSMSLTPNLNGFFLSPTSSGSYVLGAGLTPKNPHIFPLIGTLGDGSEAVIAGGFQSQAISESPIDSSAGVEFFNGMNVSLTQGGSLSDERGWGDGVVLPDGTMLASGGLTSTGRVSVTADRLLLDLGSSAPSLTTASPAGQPIQGRYLHRLTVLPDGAVLATGGIYLTPSGAPQMVTKLEIYEPPYIASGNNPHHGVQDPASP